MKSFREFINESKTVDLKSIKGAPKFLTSYRGKHEVTNNTSTSSVTIKLTDFKIPLFVTMYYSNKQGKSLLTVDNVSFDDIDRDTLHFWMAFYYPTKAAEKRRQPIKIKNDSDFSSNSSKLQ